MRLGDSTEHGVQKFEPVRLSHASRFVDLHALRLAGQGLLAAISNVLWPLNTLLLGALFLDKGNEDRGSTFPIGQHWREGFRVVTNVAGEYSFALGFERSGHLLPLRKQNLARLDEPRVGGI